jgi:hypothetical protein
MYLTMTFSYVCIMYFDQNTLRFHFIPDWLTSRKQPKMLVKMWGKWSHYTLLVDIWISPTTMEISMKVPQEKKTKTTKNKTTIWSTYKVLGLYPKASKSPHYRNMCILMFIVTQLNQPSFPICLHAHNGWIDKENVV